MAKALATATRGSNTLAAVIPPSVLDELHMASSVWLDDRLAFSEAKESGELTAIMAAAERIVAPLPATVAKHETALRAQVARPASTPEALRVVTTTMAALASGNEDGDFALEAYMQTTLDAGYCVADLELAKCWLHTPPSHDSTRPDFRLFRFKPSPAEWIELCDAARAQNLGMLRSLDRKRELEPEARNLLARQVELEAAEAESAAQTAERLVELSRRRREEDAAREAEERTQREADIAARRLREQTVKSLVDGLPERVTREELEQWKAEALAKFFETGAADDWAIWKAADGIEEFARRERERRWLAERLQRARGTIDPRARSRI